MAIPTSKDTLLSAISMNFEKLMHDLERVPPEYAQQRAMVGHAKGTTMSPAELVFYLIGWSELLLKWLDRDDSGKPINFPETGYTWRQLGELAQKFYSDYRSLTWPEGLELLTDLNAKLVGNISHRSDDELYGHPWYNKWTKGRMIQLNSAAPYANARGRIRKFLRASPQQ